VFNFWTIEVKTTGGFAPSIRTSIVLRSSGDVTLLDYRDQPTCQRTIGADELSQLGSVVAQANPGSWSSSYALASNPTGCCDMIGTTVKLTWEEPGGHSSTYETFWFDDHPPLPADLVALYDRVYGRADSTRGRLEPQCKNNQPLGGWSIEISEEGGAAYRYHRVAADSSSKVSVQPNPRSSGCQYSLEGNETRQLGDLARAANAASWAATYTRADNPNGCCDQIHTRVRLVRDETSPGGQTAQKTYTTDWYSDHPALPSDLTGLYDRVFGNALDPTAIFQRFGPQCGPVF
jgi:hypothetical protein